ncbi:unnamed protein product [Brassica oleracea var. botrytis]
MGHRRITPFLFLILLQAGVLVMESLEHCDETRCSNCRRTFPMVNKQWRKYRLLIFLSF